MSKQALSLKQSVIVIILFVIISFSVFYVGWNYGYRGYRIGIFSAKEQAAPDIARALNLIQDNFDGEIKTGTQREAALDAIVKSLGDPHSYYVTKEQYEQLKKQNTGEFVGIGIAYSPRNKEALIIEVFEGSPAAGAGLLKGDTIIKIDGIDVHTLKNDVEIKNKLIGPAETSVRLTIRRDIQVLERSVARKKVTIKNLVYKKISEGTAWLTVRQFSSRLPEEFIPIRQKLQDDTIKNLIIDLRDNLGGQTTSAVYLLDQFIQEGTFVKEVFKNVKEEHIEKASGKAPFSQMKIVVLVNKESSSGAEVFAAAIQDNKNGSIVGQKTYGKGTIGNFFELQDGSALHLTIGKWYTPSGKWIGKKGINPDVAIDIDTMTEEQIWETAEKNF